MCMCITYRVSFVCGLTGPSGKRKGKSITISVHRSHTRGARTPPRAFRSQSRPNSWCRQEFLIRCRKCFWKPSPASWRWRGRRARAGRGAAAVPLAPGRRHFAQWLSESLSAAKRQRRFDKYPQTSTAPCFISSAFRLRDRSATQSHIRRNGWDAIITVIGFFNNFQQSGTQMILWLSCTSGLFFHSPLSSSQILISPSGKIYLCPWNWKWSATRSASFIRRYITMHNAFSKVRSVYVYI